MQYEADFTFRRNRRPGLKSAFLYLGIGFVLHALALGPRIDFSDAWSYVYVLLWPAVLVVLCLKAILYVVVGAIFVGFIAYAVMSSMERLERRRANRPGVLSRLD